MKIVITFCKPKARFETMELSWTLLQNEAVLAWSNLLLLNLQNEHLELFSRFSGFVSEDKNKLSLIQGLNKCIEIINSDGVYPIEQRCPNEFTQEDLNTIHHHFEILSNEDYRQYQQKASPEVISAIRGINYFIHDLEGHTRNIALKKHNPEAGSTSILLEFRNCARYALPGTFNKYFSTKIEFGDMVLHYSQVGKTWLEAYWDKDTAIFDEAIRPLEILSGEMDILFNKLLLNKEDLDNFKKFLNSKGQSPENPDLRLGHLKVASFNAEALTTPADYEKQLAIFSDIASITMLNESEVVAKRIFSSSPNSFLR